MYRHLRAGKPRTNLRGWIFRVGHNLALKQRVRTARTEPSPETRADPAPNPEESALWNQRQTRLMAVVKALPERDRQCLYLRAEGLPYRDIACALEMSLGAVAQSLSRSLGKLAVAGDRS